MRRPMRSAAHGRPCQAQAAALTVLMVPKMSPAARHRTRTLDVVDSAHEAVERKPRTDASHSSSEPLHRAGWCRALSSLRMSDLG